jgi:hypothetical protein
MSANRQATIGRRWGQFKPSQWGQSRPSFSAKAFLARKTSEGKTPREARRALKRHLANVIYRRLHAWATTTPAMNPT